MPAERPASAPARRAPAQWLQLLAVTVAALASMATSKGYDVRRRYPVWEIANPGEAPTAGRSSPLPMPRKEAPVFVRPAGPLRVTGWIAKSGKEGLALMLEVGTRGSGPAAALGLAAARLELDGEEVDGHWRTLAPATTRPTGGTPPAATAGPQAAALPGQFLYVTFPFDNNRAWNRGVRRAVLHLRTLVDGLPLEPWQVPLVQEDRGDREYVLPRHEQERRRRQEEELRRQQQGLAPDVPDAPGPVAPVEQLPAPRPPR